MSLRDVFGIEEKLTGQTAQRIYDQIETKLKSPEFRPRALFKRFNIEVLCTTDAATDRLTHHQAIRTFSLGWKRPSDIPTRCGHPPVDIPPGGKISRSSAR